MGSDTFNVVSTKQFQQVLKSLKHVTIDPDAYSKYITDLHKKRKITKMSTKGKLTQKNLMEALVQEQGYRSRILAIKLECKHIVELIERLVEGSTFQIMHKYGNELPFKTKTENRQYVWDTFVDKIPIWVKLENCVEIADAIIEDIDKASWTSKHLISLFELSTRPELNYAL